MKTTATLPIRIAAAPVPGGPWAPVRDASDDITNYADLPARTWTQIPGTAMETTIKPILDAGGYTLYTMGSDKLQAVMNNFNGAALDPVKGKMFFTGGGHNGGSDNGVYGVDLNSMRWSIIAYPSHPVRDFKPHQLNYYRAAATQGAHVFPFADSSTGFAITAGNGFSFVGWWAVTGPERNVGPNDVVFANGDTFAQRGKHQVEIPFPKLPNGGDVLWDGRLTSRHTYGGFLYSAVADCLVSVVRAYWKCNLDGTGWVKVQDGGGKQPEKTSGELIWSHVDEKTGNVWWGGCGSGCYAYGYYFYSQGVIFDPATFTEAPTGNLRPDKIYDATRMLVNCGDLMVLPFKSGRKIGGWCKTGYGWTFDLDTKARQLVYMVGQPYSGNTGEGRSTCYIPHLGQLWAFDTSAASLPAWSMDMDSPKAGGPEGSFTIDVRREALNNAAALPSSGNGLVYTRLQFWEKHKMIVYFPGTLHDAWVCRL